MYNLVGNVIKFTFKGKVDIQIKGESDTIKTIINDTGIGIKKEEMSKLFLNFGKLKDKLKINQGGLGLGLNICKILWENLGGKIEGIRN